MAGERGTETTVVRQARSRREGLGLPMVAAVVLAVTLGGCEPARTDGGQMEEGQMDGGRMAGEQMAEAEMAEGQMVDEPMNAPRVEGGLAEGGIGAGQESARLPKPAFNASGELERPEGYREWIFVGAPVTPNDLNPPEAPFPEFHTVYIHPDDWAHWQRTGEFRDGTILIKELVSIGAKNATSGNGYFMGEFIGLEATVKDSRRFPDEPGNWAYFSFGHEYPLATTTSLQPVENCNSCHAASAADDWVFTQYYPVLLSARGGAGN